MLITELPGGLEVNMRERGKKAVREKANSVLAFKTKTGES